MAEEYSRAEQKRRTRKEGRRPRKRREGIVPKTDRRRLISHLVTSPRRSLQLCIYLYLAISQKPEEFYREIDWLSVRP